MAARPRPVRHKIDPRLELLAGMPASRLRRLHQHENRQVQALAEEWRAALADADGSRAAERRRQQRLRSIQNRLFAPITTGLYLGDPPGTARRRAGRGARSAGTSEPYVSAFVLSDAGAADLDRLGIRARSKAGDVFTAFIPLSAVDKIEQSPAVGYVELARPLAPTLDEAVPAAQISALQSGPAGLTGNGAVVGVVDYNLDVYHPDFRTASGATRVLFLWDQRLTPQAGESSPGALPGFPGASYGVEYDQATIDAELNSAVPYGTVRHGGEVESHGTHVAGIAAGNGRGQSGTFTGAAPGAGIIFVHIQDIAGTELVADNAYLADGCAYIFARAAQLGQPAVVNISLGDNQGPHDGTTLGEQFLDNLLLTPGRAITTSAGNSNNTASHAAGQVPAPDPAPGTVDLTLTYQQADIDNDGDLESPVSSDDVEIWYDGHDRFVVTVTVPTLVPTIVGPVLPDNDVMIPLLGLGGVQVRVDSRTNDPRNGDNRISIFILVPPGQQVPLGNWTINLLGKAVINGRFDAWVDRNNRSFSSFQPPFLQENQMTLGLPGTGRRLITVGNHDKTAPTPAINNSSGRGPSRDGRVKPEIATVGTGVTAPRSRDTSLSNPGALYVAKTGTSMSAPLVAGACALLFECRGPMTTWANLKQILTDTAGTAGIPVPGNAFGFGFMQVANACAAPAPNADAWLRDDANDLGVEPYAGPVFWASPDIEVLDTAGNPVLNPTHHPVNRYNNIVRVTVRNRGTQTVRNVDAFLYWADPATNIPFPDQWWSSGIYTGGPGFPNHGNVVVIPEIQPGGFVPVEFGWAPPLPTINLAGDNHFCLLARVEAESDPSNIGAGGWSAITDRNNLGLRNVHVQTFVGGDSATSLDVVGTDDQDSLRLFTEDLTGEVGLVLPVAALPWRDLRYLERHGPRHEFGCRHGGEAAMKLEATLKGEEVEELTDVTGAALCEVADGLATLWSDAESVVFAPLLRLAPGARMPAAIRVRDGKLRGRSGAVHVAQLSAGRFTGGVTLELRRKRR